MGLFIRKMEKNDKNAGEHSALMREKALTSTRTEVE